MIEISKWLNRESFDALKERYDSDGYLVFENVLDDNYLTDIRKALAPYLDSPLTGRNDFEGTKTNRVYAMLAKNPIFADLAIHPLALAFAEADLGPTLRLSACLAIQLHRDETVQPWHFDDAHMLAPRPRKAWGLSAFWAIDDTTLENGATQFLRGSHKWGDDKSPLKLDSPMFEKRHKDYSEKDSDYDIITPELPAGSLMIAKSTLWHRGGANRTNTPRTIITPQYCVGWARQLENMGLAVPPEKAAKLPKRAQELLGYSIHHPFMGYVDGMHPSKTLHQT
jgi:ectoine hydroxylase-related dioxygenase (phytanoyl-CoA dioxygenase family)